MLSWSPRPSSAVATSSWAVLDLFIAVGHKPLVRISGDRTLADISNARLRILKEKTLEIMQIDHKSVSLKTHPILISEILLSSEQSAYFLLLFNWRFKSTLFCVLYFNMKKSTCVLCQVCQTKEPKITFVEEYMSIGQFSNICCAN